MYTSSSRGLSTGTLVVALALLTVVGILVFRFADVPGTSRVNCPDCNVIVVGIDTLGAQRIHEFGYARETTPNLDALIRESYSFTNAISASSWTVPSFMSVMTSLYPSVHGVVNKFVVFNDKEQKLSNLKQLSPDAMTLAEVLRGAGYATGGFTGDAGVTGHFGYNQGFDIFTDEKAFGGLENSKGHALEWLDSLPAGQKFFMFYHGYDLHGQFPLPKGDERVFVPTDYTGPYTGEPLEEAKLREDQLHGPLSFTDEDIAFWSGLYDSKIRLADAHFGQFMAELDKRGLREKTVIIVVSDHGEEYFEHGGIDHGHTLYDELVHVPLIVHVPGIGASKLSAQVSTMDIAPTVIDILGIGSASKFANQAQGTSLVPYLTGSTSKGKEVFLETDYRTALFLRAIRTADGWKYIHDLTDGSGELYNLNVDPKEQNNLITSEPRKAAQLKESLFGHIQKTLEADPAARPEVGCLPVYPTECI